MLICPLCSAALGEVDNGVACPAGHRFDRARQGYLNLLPVQHKKSLDPGDNAAMVEARRQFLGAGHYAPLARRLAELAAERAATLAGYRLRRGLLQRPARRSPGRRRRLCPDISREAVKRACRRAPQLSWLVASMALPPGRRQLRADRQRVQPHRLERSRARPRPGGGVLRLGPASAHLLELRQRLYDDVRDYADDKHLAGLPAQLRLRHTETLEFRLALDSYDARENLLRHDPARLAGQPRAPRANPGRTLRSQRGGALRLAATRLTVPEDPMRQPDIEIYLKDAEHAAVAAWLEQALGPCGPWQEHGQTLKCTARGEHGAVRVTWLPKAVRRHSLFLESDSTPWDDDLACARAAHAALGVEILRAGRLGGKPGRRGRRPLVAGRRRWRRGNYPAHRLNDENPALRGATQRGLAGWMRWMTKPVSRRAFACGNQTWRRLPLAGLSGPGSPRIPLSGLPPGSGDPRRGWRGSERTRPDRYRVE